MGLKDILDATDAVLPDSWEILTGDSELAYEGQPLRLVWVPQAEPITPPLKMQQGRPGALWTRRSLVWAHLWAAAFTDGQPDRNADLRDHIAAAESMIQILVAALHGLWTAGGCVIDGSGQWQTGGVVTFGVGYVLPVTFLIPVPRTAPASTRIGEVDAQMQIQVPPAAAQDGPLIVVT